MHSITFECEVITPMFMAGADGRTPELRPPSIKGAMRFWWRAVNGHLNLTQLKDEEAKIFGSQERRSGFDVIVENQPSDEDINEERPVPHKNFRLHAVKPGFLFNIQLVSRQKEILEKAVYTFILLSYLGGLGKRSRRGMGSFAITKVSDKDFEHYKKFSLNNVFDIMKKISACEYRFDGDSIQLIDRTPEKYPYLKEVLAEQVSDKDKALRTVSYLSHEIRVKHKQKADYVLGSTRIGRFASPVIVSFTKGSYYLTISRLATFPKPKFRTYVNVRIQDELIEKIVSQVRTEKISESEEQDETEHIDQYREKDIGEEFHIEEHIDIIDIDFRLRKLELENFKGFRGKHTFALDDDITVFIGDNGYGKTAICEAIAIGLDFLARELFHKQLEVNIDNLSKLIHVNENEGTIKLNFDFVIIFDLDNEALERGVKQQFEQYDNVFRTKETFTLEVVLSKEKGLLDINFGKDDFWKEKISEWSGKRLIKYPFVFYGNKVEKGEIFNENKDEFIDFVYYKALTSDRYNFKDLKKWLNIIINYREKNKKKDEEIIKAFLTILSKNLSKSLNSEEQSVNYDILFKINGKYVALLEILKIQIQEIRQELNTSEILELSSFKLNDTKRIDLLIIKQKQNTIKINYEQLSSGEKNIFSIVADLTTRLFFSHQETENFDFSETKGTVIIDELDLHLHPKWQREILPTLKEIFPDLQFIITTHSPFVVQNDIDLISLKSGNIIRGRDLEYFTFKEILKIYFEVNFDFSFEIERKAKVKELFELRDEILKTKKYDQLIEFKKRIEELKIEFKDNDNFIFYLDILFRTTLNQI